MSRTLKRKRASAQPQSTKRVKNTGSQRSKTQRGPPVRSDNLAWTSVTLPDRLDDAEGFYGLEEIEDVEVIVGSDGKQILFKPRTTREGVDEQKQPTEEIETEEWTGFGDEKQTADSEKRVQLQSAAKKPPRKTDETQKKKRDNNEGNTSEKSRKKIQPEEDLAANVAYDVLLDQDEMPEVDVSAWQGLDLASSLLSALSSLGFSTPTTIQKMAIPRILQGHDLIGKAVTGSGKTLAFGIPIVQQWLASVSGSERKRSNAATALILAPTRELAHQLSKHFTSLVESLDLSPRIVAVTGGLSVLKQQRQLETADIIVGTPGRLWEVINDSYGLLSRLKKIQFLVVDEADRILSEGHFKEVEEILDVLDREVVNEEEQEDADEEARDSSSAKNRQTLVFSATFQKNLQQKLAGKQKYKRSADDNLLSNKQSMDYLLHKLPFQEGAKPVFVDASPASQMAENLSETVLECGAMQKDLYLYAFLLQCRDKLRKTIVSTSAESDDNTLRILVFTNSISSVKRLVPFLQVLDIPQSSILPLHSSMPQKSRLRSLERFTSSSPTPSPASTATSRPALSRMTVLIATDVAARGLDIKNINTIIHYHVPRTADAYVHRSGRTARSNKSGQSVLLCSPDETVSVTRLIAKIHAQSSLKDKGKEDDKSSPITRSYIPSSFTNQISSRVSLAQKITASTQSNEKAKSESNWLKNAAEELGVDYDSDEFEEAGRRSRRGRGGGGGASSTAKDKNGKAKKAEDDVADEEGYGVAVSKAQTATLKAQLKDELNRRLDFPVDDGGDGGRGGRRGLFVAGGGVDLDRLLAEREGLF